jgi:hypothetical protein
VTASSVLTSLSSPKASTLHRVQVGFRFATFAAAVAVAVCSFVAPPVAAGVFIYAFAPTAVGWALSIILHERKEHTDEVAALKAEIETLRQYRSQELAA